LAGEELKTLLFGEEGWLAKQNGVVPRANLWGVGMTFDAPLLAAVSFIVFLTIIE
jgi:hypothetical protein